MSTKHGMGPRGSTHYRHPGAVCWVLLCLVAILITANPGAADDGKSGVSITSAQRGFLPGLPGVRLFKDAGRVQQISEEMVVRILYRSLEDMTSASGKPVKFRLGGFSTLYTRDFSRIRWSELVTPPGGQQVKIGRAEIYNGNQPLGVSYEPSWMVVPSELSPDLERSLRGRPLDQLLAEASGNDARLKGVLAATRYHVTASLEGSSRDYKAAILWLDPDGDGVVTFAIQDNITERVDEAIGEKLRPRPRAALEQQIRPSVTVNDGYVQKATSCNVRDFYHSFPLTAGPDYQGHSTGSHRSGARFNYSCHCDSTCRSTCLPQVSDKVCAETGILSGAPGTHKVRTSESVVGGSEPNTDFQGADCGAGWACYVQFCPSNICSGFDISASAQPLDVGVSVTFHASGQAVWDGQLNFPFQCDGCAVGEAGDADPTIPPPDYQEYFPPGANGWYGGCQWYCTNRWDPRGTYYEECTVSC